MEQIEDWRAQQRPIPSRAASIRALALRGAAADKYLANILENSLEDLISSGVLGEKTDPEIYKRFQQVVVQSLDQMVRLDQLSMQESESYDEHHTPTPQETPSQDKCAPKKQRYSR